MKTKTQNPKPKTKTLSPAVAKFRRVMGLLPDQTPNPKPKTKTPRPAARPRTPERARFNRIMEVVVDDYSGARELNKKMDSDDERLIWLTRELREVGECSLTIVHGVKPQRTAAARELQAVLVDIVDFSLNWIMLTRPSDLSHSDDLEHIFLERAHRHTMFLQGDLPFDLNSPIVDPRRKFLVLLDRLGSVVRAMENRPHWPWMVREMIIALAAVCMAWLESFDGVKNPPTPNP